jgi:hypothetical protein
MDLKDRVEQALKCDIARDERGPHPTARYWLIAQHERRHLFESHAGDGTEIV